MRPRLPAHGEEGVPFAQILANRCPDNEREMRAFIQAWGRVEREKRRQGMTRTDVSVEEFAARWREDVGTVRESLAEFCAAFPGESTPSRLTAVLWAGIGCFGPRMLGPLLGVRLVV